jgi:hypothetical protein
MPSGTANWDVLVWTLKQRNDAQWFAFAASQPVVVTLPPRRPVVPRAPAETAQGYEGDVWWALSGCESGHTNAATGNGFWGFFQFTLATFHSLGYEGSPTDYGYETQREAAQALQARSGWGQWPACSRKLGLR